MKLSDLHEGYIRQAERPLFGGHRMPITAITSDSKPIIAIEKWRIRDEGLEKKYAFMNDVLRNKFLNFVFEFEAEAGHHAQMTIDHLQVFLRLQTKDVGKITELDKEFARFCDATFKDVMYNEL